MDDEEIEQALYAGADAGRKTPSYSETKGSTPSDAQISAFKRQVIRFLEDLPDYLSVQEVLERLR